MVAVSERRVEGQQQELGDFGANLRKKRLKIEEKRPKIGVLHYLFANTTFLHIAYYKSLTLNHGIDCCPLTGGGGGGCEFRCAFCGAVGSRRTIHVFIVRSWAAIIGKSNADFD
jgi:hypothetical protein